MIEPPHLQKFNDVSNDIIRNISDWIWETDEFGNFTYYSKHSKIFHGFSFIEFLNKNLFEIVPKKYLLDRSPIINFKTKINDIEGISIYFKINAVPYYDDENNFKGFRGITKLCNQGKTKEKKIRKYSNILETFHEYVNDLIFILNKKFQIVYLNENNLEKILGFEKEQFIGEKLIQLNHPDERKEFKKFLKNINITEDSTIKIRIKHNNGNWLWFEVYAKIFYINSSKLFYLSILRDITEKKISEDELKKSEKKYRSIFESSPNAIIILKENGAIIDCNSSSLNLSGFSRDDLIGKHYAKVNTIPEKYFKIVGEDYKKLLKGEIPDREIQLRKKNGVLRWVHYRASLIKLGNNNYIELMIEDITNIKDSEEKFHAIAENFWVALCIFQDSKTKYINQRAAEITGYSLEEIKNWVINDFLKIVHPDDVKQFIDVLEKRKIGAKNYYNKFEYRIITKENKIKWVKSISKSIPYIGKRADIFVTMEITDTKIAEEKLKKFNRILEKKIEERTDQLKKSKEELQRKTEEQALLLDNIDIQIWNLKSEDTYGAVNKAHAEFFDVNKKNVENKKILDYRALEDRKKCVEGNREVFIKKEQIKTEEWVSNKEGIKRLFSIIKTPKLDEEGNVEYVICTSQDITDQSMVQMQLKDSEKRFRTIAEQALMGIIIIQDGVIKYSNQALSSLIEYSLEEINEWKKFEIKKILHPDDFLFLMNNFVEITRAQETGINQMPLKAQVSFKIITKSNKIKWVDAYFKDIPYLERSALFGMIVDISEKKKYEESLIESERKLREQNIQLKKLDKLKSDFITIAAHELKTPLISIIGYLDLVISRDEDLKVETLEDLSRSLRNASRLEHYIDQLLDVMKIDAKKIELILKNENIKKIVDSTIKELNFQIHEKDINIEVLIDENLALNVDPFRISQVFSNLLSNAIKFSKKGGEIHISSYKKQNFEIFKIKDFGIGLSDSDIHQLFVKFVMINQNIENFSKLKKGSGLGLYITKGIVEAHGGKIWVESQGKGRGAEFYFTLPI